MITIDGGCTPRGHLELDLDDNPNGLPVLWIIIRFNNRRMGSLALNKEAVDELTRSLQRIVTEM